MKISGAHEMALPPDRAYQALQDPEVLARCIPGCEALEKIGEDEYRMKMKVAMASISGGFDGKVRISERTPPVSFRLDVEGTGRIGFVKGGGLLTVAAKGAGSEVTYDGDVQVGGTIAAIGQRLIDSTSKMMIKKFFEKLAEEARAT
jgi:carbon monoxide dehydrogenase subunit G